MPAKRAVNVLFTSVGRRVELLRHFGRAYRELALDGRIVAIDMNPLAPALQLADRRSIVPPIATPEYLPALLGVCRREAIDLVFPLIDPDVPALAEHRAAIEAVGARVAVVSPEAAAITGDKWLTARFFRQLGLPTPGTWLPGQVDPETAAYPLFIKPRRGSAGAHTFRVRNARELAFFADYVPNAVIQEYLPGPEITSDVICDLDGRILAIVCRRRIEVRWGEVAKGVTVHEPAVLAACQAIAEALPAVGPITVQCLMKEGQPHFTEINARFGGGIPLGIAAGADSPRWLLAGAAGRPVDPPPLGSYQAGLYLTRFDDSFFLSEAERAQMGGPCL